MPNLDGTGPMGQGPMTGRGMGRCGGGQKGGGAGKMRGAGRRGGYGMGRGFCGWQNANLTKEQEKALLENEIIFLKASLKSAEDELNSLDEEE